MRKGRLDMKIYKFRFTCDDYIYEVSADLQVEAETREEADKKVMRLLYEEYPIAKTNNTASIKLMEVDCISEPKEPCEYCVSGVCGNETIYDEMDRGFMAHVRDGILNIGVATANFHEHSEMRINYCPMCGRKLEAKE